MPDPIVNNWRQAAYKTIVIQGVVLIVLSLIAAFGWSRADGLSLFLGGLCSVLPNGFFARRCFSCAPTTPMKKRLAVFYRAELFKFLMCVVLMLLILKQLPVRIVAFFAGFLLTQFAVCLAPLFRLTRDS